MNENIDKPTMKLPPLKRICMTIGQLPASYVESMSYYEMLVWFIHYLRDEVIPVVNANGEAVKELQELYVQLQEYVNNYFENLDVQEEINNKLDEMAESGQLTDIIAQYLGLAGMITFNNVSEMKEAQNLVNGSKCETLGFYNAGDNGGANYKVRAITNDDVVDEKIIIALYDDNLIAELVSTREINPEMLGAKGDGTTDDTNSLQAALDYCNTKKIPLILSQKTYKITSSLTTYSYLEISGNNATIQTTDNIKMITGTGSHMYIHDLNLLGNNGNDSYGMYMVCYFSLFRNITIGNIKYGVYINDSAATGTLVENRFENMKVYGYDYAGLYLGENNNTKVTDGYLTNAILSGNTGATYGIFIGSSAGWTINGVHVYGHNDRGVQLNNSNCTNVSNIYIETFDSFGLVMPATQVGNNVNNIFIKHSASGTTGDAIHIEVSGYMPGGTHSGNLSNVNIYRGAITTGKSINIAGGPNNAWYGSNIIIDSTANKTLDNDCTGLNYNMYGIHYINESKISIGNSSGIYNYINGYNFIGINPNAVNGDIILPTLPNTTPVAIKVIGVAGQWTSQSGKFYEGLIYVVKDGSGNLHAWIKNSELDEIFSTSPSISVDDVNNKLTLSFAVNTTLYGRLYYSIMS